MLAPAAACIRCEEKPVAMIGMERGSERPGWGISAPDPWSVLHAGPLKDPTVKKRRVVLTICFVVCCALWTGLYPRKIEALGLEFSATNPRALTMICVTVLVYFYLCFIVYVRADLEAWWSEYQDACAERKGLMLGTGQGRWHFYFELFRHMPNLAVRILLIEVGLPLVLGGATLLILISATF